MAGRSGQVGGNVTRPDFRLFKFFTAPFGILLCHLRRLKSNVLLPKTLVFIRPWMEFVRTCPWPQGTRILEDTF